MQTRSSHCDDKTNVLSKSTVSFFAKAPLTLMRVACGIVFGASLLGAASEAWADSFSCNLYNSSFSENFSNFYTEFNYRSTVLGWGSGGPLTQAYRFGVFPPLANNPRQSQVGQRILAAGDGQGAIHNGAEDFAALIDSGGCHVQWFAYSASNVDMTQEQIQGSPTSVVDSSATCGSAAAVAVNDVNGDGIYDIVVASVTNPSADGTILSATLYLNLYYGYSWSKVDLTSMLQAYNVAWHATGTPLRLEDVNGDGRTDLLVLSSHGTTSEVLCFLATPPGSPGGFLTPPLTLVKDTGVAKPIADVGVSAQYGYGCPPSAPSPNLGATAMAFEDFDGDGFFDLAISGPNENTLKLFYNNGDNTFSRGTDVSFPAGGAAFAYAFDFDNDGTNDIAVVRSGLGCGGAPGEAWMFYNPAGNGNFVMRNSPLVTTNSSVDWASVSKYQIVNATTYKSENFAFGLRLGRQTQQGNFTEWYNQPNTSLYNLQSTGRSYVMWSGVASNQSLVSAQIASITKSTPSGTSMTIQGSPDGGNHWETFTAAEVAGAVHNFVNFGQQYAWRVLLNSPAASLSGANAAYAPAATATPTLSNISFNLVSTDSRLYSRSSAAYGSIGTGAAATPYVYNTTFSVPGFWGQLQATSIATTTVGNANSLQTVVTAPTWNSGTLLQSRSGSARKLYAAYPGAVTSSLGSTQSTATSLMNFSTTELTSGASKNPNLNQLLQVPASLASTYVGYVNSGFNDSAARKQYDAGHSSPVFVGPPSQDANYMGSGYASFATSNASRTPVVLLGANDGMLHAFDATSGTETWGLIPYNLLGKLKNLVSFAGANHSVLYSHDYFVDGPISVSDVYSGGAWHTVAVFGQGQGQGINKNNYYSAVDVTNPSSPTPLWEFTETFSGRDAACDGNPSNNTNCVTKCAQNTNCTTQNTAYNGDFNIRTTTPDFTGQPAGLIEAEHFDSMRGSIGSPQDNWNTFVYGAPYTLTARNTSYIQSQGAVATCPGTTPATKGLCTAVTYRFNVDAASAGTYYPIFKVNVAAGAAPSLSWGIDGGYNWGGTLGGYFDLNTPWRWMFSTTAALSAGDHTLTIWMNSTNVYVDAIAMQKQVIFQPLVNYAETPATVCDYSCAAPVCSPYTLPNPTTQEWPECGSGAGLKCCTAGTQNFCYPVTSACPTTMPSVMGESFSPPSIGRFQTASGDKWVAFFASGYNPFGATIVGRSVYAVDAYTGIAMGTWPLADVANPVQNPNINDTIPGGVRLVDSDSDGYVDRVYVGDLAGRMWKIDTSKVVALSSGHLANPADYPACVIFDAGDPSQTGGRTWAPISETPAAVVFNGNATNVYFGTGGDDSAPASQYYRFYSVRDLDAKGVCTTQHRKDTDLSASNLEWFVTDPNQGNRFFADPTVVNGSVVYFSSFNGLIEGVNPCTAASAGSNVYGIATRTFVGSDGRSYTAGKSVLAGGVQNLKALGVIRTAATAVGAPASQTTRAVSAYATAPTDLYFQQYSGELLRLSAPGARTAQGFRIQRWRELTF